MHRDPIITACQSVIRSSTRRAVASWLRCSIDTLDRMLSTQADSRWTHARIQALRRYEALCLRTTTIRDAAMDAEREPIPGDALNVARGLNEDLAAGAALIALEASTLAGSCAIGQLRRVEAAIAADVQRKRTLLADVRARIGFQKVGVA